MKIIFSSDKKFEQQNIIFSSLSMYLFLYILYKYLGFILWSVTSYNRCRTVINEKNDKFLCADNQASIFYSKDVLQKVNYVLQQDLIFHHTISQSVLEIVRWMIYQRQWYKLFDKKFNS